MKHRQSGGAFLFYAYYGRAQRNTEVHYFLHLCSSVYLLKHSDWKSAIIPLKKCLNEIVDVFLFTTKSQRAQGHCYSSL